MPVKALIFGSIGVVAETSDIQRRAYNAALAEAGVAWTWTPEIYRDLLKQSGGRDRLSQLASATGEPLGETVIERIHARKTEIACAELVESGVGLRPGVAELIAEAKRRGIMLAFVTTTYQANIEAIFTAAGPAFARADFAYVGSRDDVERGKPAPDAYVNALEALGIAAEHAVAIEDTAVSVMSAKRAGIVTIATPGELSAGQDLWQADLVLDALADADGTVDARVVEMLDRA